MTIVKDIYKYFFGKNYEPIWRQFAKENNGTYLAGSKDKVEFSYKEHIITFDAYSHYTTVGGSSFETEYTRGKVEFISPDNLKLKLTVQGVVDNIGKLLGTQDIVVGDKKFDKKFMIKGNDEYKAQLIFSNSSIKSLLLEQKLIRLEITATEGLFDEKIQEGYSMLYYVSSEKIKHIDQLNKLYKLFTEIMDVLSKTSSIKTKKASS